MEIKRRKKKISNKTKKLIKNIMMGLLFQFYVCLRYYVDLSIDFLFGWYFDKQRKYIPNAKDPLILESASSIARKIRERKVKAEDVVRTYIERVKQVNGILNAVVDERFTDALQEARKIDQDIESGKITEEDFKKRPFLGVPFTTKESTSCKGLKYSMGLRCRKDILGKEDAKVISLMKRAGGILIGVTNVPQINLWTESYNPVYGTTNNPYNTTRNVGGSSGGEASILAAGGSPIGIGGDIGGSLRIPSFRCGVFAHKCSPDLLSFHGLGFRTGDELPSMVVPGPMTRYAEDLIPLFKVLLDDKVIKLRLDDEVNIEKLNVFYSLSMHCPFASPIHNNIKECVRKVVNHFSKISEIKPQEVHFEKTRYAVRLWSYKMTQEQNDYRADICDRRGKASLPSELVKTVLRCSEYNLYVIYNLINELLPKAPRDWAEKTIRELKDEITAKLGDNGVLLFPSESFTASYHYTSLLRPWNMSYYALWNALNLPVTQVPLGLSEDGLPLGIQVIAAPYCDHLCIAMAKELEKAFGGYVPPFELEK